MHRALCWATAVEVNVVIAATSSDVLNSSSATSQVNDVTATAQPRTTERACLTFIESSRKSAAAIQGTAS
jgi:hypothetical protein